MIKRLFFIFLALVAMTSFAAAAEPSNSVYKFDPVQDSLLDAAMMVTPEPIAFEPSDSRFLADIRNAMVAGYSNYTSSSVLGLLNRILDKLSSSSSGGYYSQYDRDLLANINGALTGTPKNSAMNSVYDLLKKNLPLIDYLRLNNGILKDFYNDTAVDVEGIRSDVSAIEYLLSQSVGAWTKQQAESVTSDVSTLGSFFRRTFDIPLVYPDFSIVTLPETLEGILGRGYSNMVFDGLVPGVGSRTLYGRIAQLQETLASDDDKALADAQKPNREQIEQDFVTGSSGGTSLGPQDFGDLSDVGGSIKDIAGLNGQASVGTFTDGLSQADKEGQGWFSASTRDSLDAVTDHTAPAPATADRSVDDDPYNMSGFSSHYDWLFGGAVQ